MTLNVDQIRIDLLRASKETAAEQHALFIANDGITLEYSLLGNLGDLLAAAAMLTHTIDRAHSDTQRAARTVALTSDDTFLGSTS